MLNSRLPVSRFGAQTAGPGGLLLPGAPTRCAAIWVGGLAPPEKKGWGILRCRIWRPLAAWCSHHALKRNLWWAAGAWTMIWVKETRSGSPMAEFVCPGSPVLPPRADVRSAAGGRDTTPRAGRGGRWFLGCDFVACSCPPICMNQHEHWGGAVLRAKALSATMTFCTLFSFLETLFGSTVRQHMHCPGENLDPASDRGNVGVEDTSVLLRMFALD